MLRRMVRVGVSLVRLNLLSDSFQVTRLTDNVLFMGIGRRLGAPGFLVAIPAATFGVETAAVAPEVSLGSSPGAGWVDSGTGRPQTISLGSCADAVSRIVRDSAGGPTAHGTATAWAKTGPAPNYDLVACDTGNCLGETVSRILQTVTDDPLRIWT